MGNGDSMQENIRVIPEQVRTQLDQIRSFTEHLTRSSGTMFGGQSEALDTFLRLYRLFLKDMASYRSMLETDLQNAGYAVTELEDTDEKLLY